MDLAVGNEASYIQALLLREKHSGIQVILNFGRWHLSKGGRGLSERSSQ